MNKDELISKLATIRNEAKLSARALSINIGMNEGYMNRMESSKSFLPSMEVFFEILDVCGYTAEKFFYHDSKNFEKDMELLERFKSLSDEKKQALLTLLKK